MTSCARKQCMKNSKSVRFKSRLVPDLHDLLTLVYACHYIAVFAHDGQHDFFIGHWLSFWSAPSLGRVLFFYFSRRHACPSISFSLIPPSLTAYGVDFFCDCPPCFSLLYDNLAYLFGLRYKAVIKLNFFQQAGVFFFRKVCLAPLQHCTFCPDAVPGTHERDCRRN